MLFFASSNGSKLSFTATSYQPFFSNRKILLHFSISDAFDITLNPLNLSPRWRSI